MIDAFFKELEIVLRSFCKEIGFSKKSVAPIFVASIAVSIVPCPDIIITGQLISLLPAHSLSKDNPSISGIHISSKIRSIFSDNFFSFASEALAARKIL